MGSGLICAANILLTLSFPLMSNSNPHLDSTGPIAFIEDNLRKLT